MLSQHSCGSIGTRSKYSRVFDNGRRTWQEAAGFDYSNSPVVIANADVQGRVLVQRTSAGTQGVIAASDADRLFAASLVCASATADAINKIDSAPPTYVITGRFADGSDYGEDDLLTAQLIERVRCGDPIDAAATAKRSPKHLGPTNP